MLLDLSELFVCPRCRPAQGLVVLVDELRERRVVRGRLGCPECEARYPLSDGVLRLDGEAAAAAEPAGSDPSPERGSTPALLRGTGPAEAAVRLGALLGLPEAEGPFLLGPGLSTIAAPLARVAEDAEVLSLVDPPGPEGDAGSSGENASPGEAADAEGEGKRVIRIVGASPSELPVFSARLGGVAVVDGGAGVLEEAVRTLERGGRAVVLDPAPELGEAAEELTAEIAAADERALVAVRRR